MCGIIGGFIPSVERGIEALSHRGPDARGEIKVGHICLGHTRLAIQDLDSRSNQPFKAGNTWLSYNGELWNHLEIKAELELLGHTFITAGDTEVVAHALDQWGTDALSRLEGMFALAWTTDGEVLYLARDRHGEVPLHAGCQRPFLFASEVKALLAMGVSPASIQWIRPGEYWKVSKHGVIKKQWYKPSIQPSSLDLPEAAVALHSLLQKGCKERTISDVPICTLLSGGIDSATVALFLGKQVPDLTCYTAVMNSSSRDLRCTRLVARHLGLPLVEVRIPEPTPANLGQVIRAIEMPHKAQAEIGWACLKLAEAMQSDGFKVTFSGEGSDELWASYGFSYHALAAGADWHTYRRDLFMGQHRKNFARCNKVFMAYGIECRLPFLHTDLVKFALSLRKEAVQNGKARPKAVIQDAIRGLLPDEVIGRPKVAFQDGLGLKKQIESILPNPASFYRAEYYRLFKGVEA